MRIINPGKEDYHMHSITFSDGLNTIYELVRFAGKIGLETIAITDHSQAMLNCKGFSKQTYRDMLDRWENVHNSVEVLFGVEGDLLKANGDICSHIQEVESQLLILSAHPEMYTGGDERITEAYLNAIQRYHNKIDFIGHPCAYYFEESLDIEKLIKAANLYSIPMEFNCANLHNRRTNMDNLQKMLRGADLIIVNSDAHSLVELRDVRTEGFKYLKENGFL